MARRKNPEHFELAIASALLGTVVVILSLTMPWAIRWPPISTEAWMNFAGSLVGAAVTVIGSVLVLEYQWRRRDRAKRTFFWEALDDVIGPLEAIQANTPSELERASGQPLSWHSARIEAGLAWLERIMEWQPPNDMATLRAYDEVRQVSRLERDNLIVACRDAQAQINDRMPAVIGASHPILQRLRTARRGLLYAS